MSASGRELSGIYRELGVFLAVSERSLLILKVFEETYCEFGTIEAPNLEH